MLTRRWKRLSTLSPKSRNIFSVDRTKVAERSRMVAWEDPHELIAAAGELSGLELFRKMCQVNSHNLPSAI